jgi:hypothetical protein
MKIYDIDEDFSVVYDVTNTIFLLRIKYYDYILCDGFLVVLNKNKLTNFINKLYYKIFKKNLILDELVTRLKMPEYDKKYPLSVVSSKIGTIIKLDEKLSWCFAENKSGEYFLVCM